MAVVRTRSVDIRFMMVVGEDFFGLDVEEDILKEKWGLVRGFWFWICGHEHWGLKWDCGKYIRSLWGSFSAAPPFLLLFSIEDQVRTLRNVCLFRGLQTTSYYLDSGSVELRNAGSRICYCPDRSCPRRDLLKASIISYGPVWRYKSRWALISLLFWADEYHMR